MRRYAFAIALGVAVSAMATVVVDENGEAVGGAPVFSVNGAILALTDDNGGFGQVSPGDYPLLIKSVGLEDAHVAAAVDTVRMRHKDIELASVVVSTEERPIMRQLCLVKEVASCILGKDTLLVTQECMADYFFATRKAKKFGDKSKPVMRNRRVSYRSTSTEKVDTAEMVSLASMLFLAYRNYEVLNLPDSLKDREVFSDTVCAKKTGYVEGIMTRSRQGLSLYRDGLASHEGHQWSPALLKLLGMSMTFNEIWIKSNFVGSGPVYSTADETENAFAISLYGTGKFIKLAFGTKDPVTMRNYIEIVPLETTMLSVEEAKELRDSKFTVPFPK